MLKLLTLALLAATLQATLQAPLQAQVTLPPHGRAIKLFNNKDLTTFDTFLRDKGLNTDPNHVFSVEHKTIHVSGDGFGYLLTKNSYKDFILKAQFKWGEGTFLERKGQARDSGILFNVEGENKVWPRSIEFQVTEGGTGDFWLVGGAGLTATDGHRVENHPNPTMIAHVNKGKFANVTGVRDPTGELEKPHGQWNQLVLVNQAGHIWLYVNGKLANEGTAAIPSEGKILFQSEGAEVFYRNLVLYPLK